MVWPLAHELVALFLCFCLVQPVPVLARELAGRILAVDRESRTFVLEPLELPARQVIVGFAETYPLRDREGRPVLPGCVVRQQEVLLDGEFSGEDGDLFLATRVTGLHCRFRHDPTGVRYRLGMGCRRGRQNLRAHGAAGGSPCRGRQDAQP